MSIIEEIKDLGCTGGCSEEQIKEVEEIGLNPVLKTHIDDGDKLVWYKDPNIIATWHSNGKLDVPCFDATDVSISAVNFRILKGHWRTKTEHSIGTESNHWLFNGRPVSEYLELYPDFWKSKQPKQPRQKKETSNKTAKTTSVITSEHEDIVKEYKYESEKLLFGSSFSGLYPDKLKKQATPSWVAEDMVDILPDEVWRTDSKFLDIYCKSGIFLEIIINKLMEKVDYSSIGLTSDREIRQYIIENQIYAVCWNKEYLDLSRRVINGKASKEVNIHCIGPEIEYMDEIEAEAILKNDRAQGSIDKAILGIDIRKEFFNNMQLDVVIGNPPYNNDIYIPFVEMGHNLASTCSVFITPAKWQAKGGKKNEQFRQNIVPNIKEIITKESKDVFNISLGGCVAIYNIYKDTQFNNKILNGTEICNWTPQLGFDKVTIEILNKIREIDKVAITSCGDIHKTPEKSYFTSANFGDVDEDTTSRYYMRSSARCIKVPERVFRHTEDMDKYKVYVGHVINPKATVHLVNPYVADVREDCLIGFGNKEFCESIKSYYECRLIWYLVYSTNCGNISKEAFANVPDPGAFDHIFTDEELYKKYNLTQEEINIIESVIKERK